MSNIFGLSIFFVEEPPLYILQDGGKLAPIIYIYIYIFIYLYLSSRLPEYWMAQNMAKQKNMGKIFLDYLSFLWKSHLRISNRVTVKRLLLKIYMFKVVWAPNGFEYGKTKKHVNWFFEFSKFFVEEPPLYLQQGGRKTWSKTHPRKNKKVKKST